MTIEEALYAHLVADSGVAAQIGNRLYPLVIPQDAALPAAAYQRISGPRVLAHDGTLGLADARMQFTSHAETYSDAKALARAIRESVDGYRGVMGGAGGVMVQGCSVENETDSYGPAGEVRTVRLDVFVLYSE